MLNLRIRLLLAVHLLGAICNGVWIAIVGNHPFGPSATTFTLLCGFVFSQISLLALWAAAFSHHDFRARLIGWSAGTIALTSMLSVGLGSIDFAVAPVIASGLSLGI